MRERWVESDRLDAILDQIVAVQLDLKLVCNGKNVDQNDTTIAETCKILQSAAVELRNVILRLDDQRSETTQTPSWFEQASGAETDLGTPS